MRAHNFFRTAIIFCLLIIFNSSVVNGQKLLPANNNQWQQVDTLMSKGLTKSALTIVDKIYASAKQKKIDAQIIKALLYKINLQRDLEENASTKNIDNLDKEISEARQPAKSILESITAQLYWNYFQQNRYKLYNRTNTAGFNKKDMATWTADDLHNKISNLYLASINDKNILQKQKLEPFEAIIIKGNTRSLRPTLYDLLAHRALNYFKSDEHDISRPAYYFEIKDKEAFAPDYEFIKHQFITKDSASLHQKALLVLQYLLAFHINDQNPDALIDADIERIDFAHQYAVILNKDSLYINALDNIAKKYKDYPVSAQASFLKAQIIYNNANVASDNENTISKYSIKQAKEILDEIANKFPKSEGGVNARNLISEILHPQINLITEKVNVPGFPFRTLVSYKNFSTVYFRVIQLSHVDKEELDALRYDEKIFQKLTGEKSIKEWKQDLPANSDYLAHSVEVKIDALPVGEYLLLGSAAANFSVDKNPLAVIYFYVSDISFINNDLDNFVLNRTTGQPLKGAWVKIYTQNYDDTARKYKLRPGKLLLTDGNGYFKLPPPEKNENSNVMFDITYEKDQLFLDDFQYQYSYDYNIDQSYTSQKKYDEANAKIFLFTDRSIYRPGQLVYFKGIGVTKKFDTKKTKLLESKDSLTVYLKNANNQNIDSLKVLLNDFGSFNGKFRLPENELNGDFEIQIVDYKNSDISFSVEEYKRPKFYTEFDTLKVSYRLGDTVSISGFAKAYAENSINGAKVSYRVTRVARFLYPWMFWRTIMPRTRPLEITHNEITTDAEGKFMIQFAAIPDVSLAKSTDPVFDYKVEADVTDINGETRSSSIVVPIGYKALNLEIELPEGAVINIDSLKNIIVTSKNLSDQEETVKAEVEIYKLQPPQRLIRPRLWKKPDQYVLSENQFLEHFPSDEYADEIKKETWPKVDLVYDKSDSTNNLNFNIQNLKISQGFYVVEATAKDPTGQEVKNVKYLQVYNLNSDSLPAPSYVWNTTINNSAEPGQIFQIITGSSSKNVFLIQEINRQSALANNRLSGERNKQLNFFSLTGNKKTFDFNITEDDRGGFGVNQFFVKNNRFYVTSNIINVPWSNKDLNISFDTYRDKTLPGSEEKWKVKISGSKGEKVAAEMLASMYDASLDQFKPHLWSLPDIWPTYSGNSSWDGNQNFSTVQSFENYWSDPIIQPKEKIYDALNYLPKFMTIYLQRNTSELSTVVITTEAARRMNISPASPMLDNSDIKNYNSKDIGKKNDTLNEFMQSPIDQSKIQIRKNFNETVFFYPELRTDKNGDIEFNFTMPEALTKWKLMALAHTKYLASGYAEKAIITQKDLMVQPNAPRFLRAGDRMEFSAKIVNLGNKEVSGQADFQLLKATDMKPADSAFNNKVPSQTFRIAARQSTLVTFNINIPQNFNDAIIYRIVAKAGNVSDGEEATIPVVTSRMLVTEGMPLAMRSNGTKDFKFEKLINSGNSNTLTNYGLTVEYTTNPAWYAMQSLPYLIEYPYECAEQTFNRYYANAMASKIVNASPKIKAVFEKWRTTDTLALLSNLQKNEELKSVLLQETPWVLQAQNEDQQKKSIALLFDMAKMNLQLQLTLDKLIDIQLPNGAFAWFKGGRDNRYITQYILTGIGHLAKLNASTSLQQADLKVIVDKGIPFLDQLITNDYNDLVKSKTKLAQDNLSAIVIQYLYMRSFFREYPIAKENQTAYKYYREQSKKYWLNQGKYMQAMIALSLYRTKDDIKAQFIIKSLKENSIDNEELGMYWKDWNNYGYWWYEAPVESQALMIEAFSEIEKDPKTINDLKTWLLKNKQVNDWKTTKATAEACYALLLPGTDWLSEERKATIKLGNIVVNSTGEAQEDGSGYFKEKIDGQKVNSQMGNISVTISSQNIQSTGKANNQSSSWGSVYWQYFENLDKITFAETPLKLSKKLFVEKNTDRGPVLRPVSDSDLVHVGDKIKVRIELRVDRDMEYVHMKDMRASCMEPANVISEYKYQDGLGYYETTKDVSTNFFFEYLRKGIYVFEYPMFVTHKGNFSNGVTTIQCMYAPEFTSHSEGVRVSVK